MARFRLGRWVCWGATLCVFVAAGCQRTGTGPPKARYDRRAEEPHDPLLDWPQDLPPLMDAARRGDVAAVRRLARRGRLDLNARYQTPGRRPRGRTCWSGMAALHWAVRHNHPEVVEELLRLGADPEVGDAYGRAPLNWAAQAGHLEVVKALIAGGARANAQAVDPEMPSVRETALHRAAAGGHAEVVAYLLEHGATVGARDGSGRTALHWAAEAGGARVAKVLMARGGKDLAGPRCRRHSRVTQRRLPAEQAEAAQVLLERGADVNARDQLGATPLHMAKWHYVDFYAK